ncbi:MAG: hypothetical protein ACFKPT_16460 [Gloeotrichia echinulata GP01]
MRDDDKWAYSRYKVHDLFKLAWKDSEDNARKPEKDDLILLRQRGYVTHLVRVLDYKPEREDWKGDYDIYRIVEVFWTIDFVNPPASAKADKMFDYSAVSNPHSEFIGVIAFRTTYSATHSDSVQYHIAMCRGTALPCPYECT